MSHFNMRWDEVVWERSWANIVMLSATVPKYKKEEKKEDIIQTDSVEGLEGFIKAKK